MQKIVLQPDDTNRLVYLLSVEFWNFPKEDYNKVMILRDENIYMFDYN